MERENAIEYKVYGKYALFTDPLTKTGGEKLSYQVPTYQALKGITESIYWKPTFTWVIDECRVMHPIRTESKGMRPIKYQGGNDLASYTYLKDVEYRVKAHFVWNENRPDLVNDRNENKHYQIAKRMLERGGRRDIFLGTRECQGYVEPCTVMENEKKHMTIRLWNAYMKDGVIRFPEPEECQIRKVVAEMEMKTFDEKNFCGIREFERGNLFGLDTNA